MSPLVDAGAVLDDDSDLPRAVSWLELTDPAARRGSRRGHRALAGVLLDPHRPGRPAGLAAAAPGTLRAVVGTAADGPHALDLRMHGPHALLGGTTGAGKSELLQTWILAMAAAHSPQRVTSCSSTTRAGRRSATASSCRTPSAWSPTSARTWSGAR